MLDEFARSRHVPAVGRVHDAALGAHTVGRRAAAAVGTALGANGTGTSVGAAHDRPGVAAVGAAGAGARLEHAAGISRVAARARGARTARISAHDGARHRCVTLLVCSPVGFLTEK